MIGAVLVGIWAIARVWFSSSRGARRVETVRMPPRRRLLLALLSVSLVPIYVFYFSDQLDTFIMPLPAWATWTGDALLAASVALFIWCQVTLGASWSAHVEFVAGQPLVTKGPYRLVRHPLYSSLMLMAIGLGPATANPVVTLPYAAAVVAMYLDRFRDEERLMLESFGKPYADYLLRTGRLLPRDPRLTETVSATSGDDKR